MNSFGALSNRVKIKGVLFDVDGTLYYQFPLRIIMAAYLITANILHPLELLRKIKIIFAHRSAQEQLRFSMDENQVSASDQIALTVSKTRETSDYVKSTIREWMEEKPLPFLCFCRRRGLLKILGNLKKNGFILGVFSDYPALEKLKALGVDGYFDRIICSYDSNVTGFKPDTNGFLVAAKAMGLKPSQILYVGDRIDIDGKGARKAGMNAVIINGLSKNKTISTIPVVNTIKGILWHIHP